MPIPTADQYDKEQNAQSTGSASHTSSLDALSSAGSQSSSARRSEAGFDGTSGPVSATSQDSDRALSREEADRLYEERMEEEYAKREGGA